MAGVAIVLLLVGAAKKMEINNAVDKYGTVMFSPTPIR